MQGTKTQSSSKSLRILITGDVSGTLEPCGCVKDQLGGLDRFATALLDARRAHDGIFVEVGALFFPRPKFDATERDELLMRAETLAKGMRTLGLTAWAPGEADWALGEPTFEKLATDSGASARTEASRAGSQQPPAQGAFVREISGIRVGLYALQAQSTSLHPGTRNLESQLASTADDLESQRVQLKVALIDAPMGAITRAVHQVHAFQLVIVNGNSAGLGADSDGTPPQLIDSTLVVNPPNHLRGLTIVDFTVERNNFKFEDASGVGREEEHLQLGQRIVELSERVKQWKKENRDTASIAAREADLKRLREKLASLEKPLAKPSGSNFTVRTQPIGNEVERNPDMQRALEELGRRINVYNRDKFAGVKAPAPIDSQPVFIGVNACEKCHKEAVAFWRTTRHSKAYRTLVNKDRQYTLECVACHVAGFEQPGGSSVTDVELLKDVQCENCHGPGSAHAKANTKEFIKPSPDRQLCANKCHHSPHVNTDWSVSEAWPKIIGAGHGE
jgi:hypothetical protein